MAHRRLPIPVRFVALCNRGETRDARLGSHVETRKFSPRLLGNRRLSCFAGT